MLNKLKISAKLNIGFGLMVALVLAVAATAYINEQTTQKDIAESHKTTAAVVKLKDAILAVRQGRVMIWAFAATGDAKYLGERDKAFAKFDDTYKGLGALVTDPDGTADIAAFNDTVTAFEQVTGTMETVVKSGVSRDDPQYRSAVDALNAAAKAYAAANDKAGAYFQEVHSASSKDLDRQIAFSNQLYIGLGLLSVIVGSAVAWLVGASIVRPVRRITETMQKISAGNYGVQVPALSNGDEIGDMARTVEVFRENLQTAEIYKVEQEQAKAQADTTRREGMLKLADRFEKSVGGIVSLVASAAIEMQASAEQLSSSARETSAQSVAVSAAAEEAGANVTSVASATEELGASVNEIGRQVRTSASVSDIAVRDVDSAVRVVRELNERAASISGVVDMIAGLASQTNLLALNATIESARAGEAGRGFAVVASEVKALAAQTAKATGDISEKISQIQEATEQAAAAIQGITQTIQTISDNNTTISAAVTQQTSTTEEIARAVSQAALGTGEVTENMAGVAKAAEQTGDAAALVLNASRELSAHADQLTHEVSSFLAGVRAA